MRAGPRLPRQSSFTLAFLIAALASCLPAPAPARAQIATLDKGHQILVDRGLQIGGLIALKICGMSISMPVYIGLLMLFGIVAKNSILLVDFAIEEMRRGSDAELVPIHAWINFSEPDPESLKKYRELHTEANYARQNAVGMLTVNVSLGIRRAFDRLAEHRDRGRAKAAA